MGGSTAISVARGAPASAEDGDRFEARVRGGELARLSTPFHSTYAVTGLSCRRAPVFAAIVVGSTAIWPSLSVARGGMRSRADERPQGACVVWTFYCGTDSSQPMCRLSLRCHFGVLAPQVRPGWLR